MNTASRPVAWFRRLTAHAGAVIRPVMAPLATAAAVVMSLYVCAVCTANGQLLDDLGVLGSDVVHPDPAWAQRLLATVADDRSIVVAVGMPVLLGVLRREVATGAVVAGAVLAANLTTQVLKLLVFLRPELVVNPAVGTGNSFPSGTATFLMTLALGVVAMLPRVRVGRMLALPTMAVLGGVATISLDWHRPSDVVAGVVVAVGWFIVARSLLDHRSGRPGSDRPQRDWRPAVRGLVALGALCVVPVAAVALAPFFAPELPHHGAFTHLAAVVVVTVGCTLAVRGLCVAMQDVACAAPARPPVRSALTPV